MGQVSVRSSPGTIASVTKALRIMEVVASDPRGVTARSIADELGLALPTTYHLLSTLIDSGYVVHLASEHRYALGYGVRRLDRGLHRQLAVEDDVAAAVRALHLEADAAAYYAVFREAGIVIAHVADSERRRRVQLLDVGFDESAHATAFGKVMLAGMDRDQLHCYLDGAGMAGLTRSTIVQPDQLERHLTHVRESNVALEIGELQAGLSCMAAPVRSPGGDVIGSIAISLRSPEFQARRWDIERAVRTGANRVTRALRAAHRRAPGATVGT